MAAPKVKRFWFVIPNNIEGNGQRWYGPEGQQQQQPELEEARPRERDARGNRIRAAEEAQEAPVELGVGIYLGTKEGKEIMAFTTKGKAVEYAKYQASMNPQKLYGVFECDSLYETTEPTVLQKKFNDAGELILDSGV